MTPRTVARRLSVIRQFFRFLLAEHLRNDDPASALDSPQLGRPLPKILSRVEVDRLIAATQAQGVVDGGRMATLLEILYTNGPRVPAVGVVAVEPLRHRRARLGAGGPAAGVRRARSVGAGVARQGRQGAAGASVG